ncbi:hypothetical protein M758_9G115400 [Ceratodon purpureus]|nr:hypothetical protein M758_9G115400 [Ceratodon purpureus]
MQVTAVGSTGDDFPCEGGEPVRACFSNPVAAVSNPSQVIPCGGIEGEDRRDLHELREVSSVLPVACSLQVHGTKQLCSQVTKLPETSRQRIQEFENVQEYHSTEMSCDQGMEEVRTPSTAMDCIDVGLAEMEDQLRKAVKGSSHVALQDVVDIPGMEIDVPLCRMIPMKDVREPLKTDIQKLKAEFSHGYKRGSSCFYLSLKSFRMEESSVTEADRSSWSDLWQKEDLEFEARLLSNPDLKKYSDRYFYVWDENHRHIAWSELINSLHKHDASFHVSARSIIINVTPANCNMLLHAMTDWNKKNEVDHVVQHWTHEVKRVQQLGLLDFDQLKGLVKDEDLQASILE